MKISIVSLFMGFIFFMAGWLAFTQASSEYYQLYHNDLPSKILAYSLGFLFMAVGFIMFVSGLFGGFIKLAGGSGADPVANSKQDQKTNIENDSNKSKNRPFFYVFLLMFFYALFFAGNWNLNYLKKYFENRIYVELPEGVYSLDQISALLLKPKFFQYTPTFFGNTDPHYFEPNSEDYQFEIVPMDSQSEKNLWTGDGHVTAKKMGDYFLKLSVKSTPTSPYKFQLPISSSVFIKPKTNTRKWDVLNDDRVPEKIAHQLALLEKYFSVPKNGGMTLLNNTYYVNTSYSFRHRSGKRTYYPEYFKIDKNIDQKKSWKPLEPIYSNVIHAHNGKIVSFGGFFFGDKPSAGNWIYSPKQDSWEKLADTPIASLNYSDFLPAISSVFSANNKLYVLTKEKSYQLYEVEINDQIPTGRWHLIKQFSLPNSPNHWYYLNDHTLYSYDIEFPWGEGDRKITGYIQTLDLNDFSTKTITELPDLKYVEKNDSVFNKSSWYVRVLSEDGQLFVCYANKCVNENT